MDEGTGIIYGALIGGLIGAFSSATTTLLAESLRKKRSNRLDKIRKERLKQLLSNGKYKWRNLPTLCDAIGAGEEETASLLLEIGARRSMAGTESWGLISRNPFPDDSTG